MTSRKTKQYYVYIVTNKNHTTFYTGMSDDIIKRVGQHKEGKIEGFTKRYNLTKLVYYEIHDEPLNAIKREKRIKKWKRNWKIRLITDFNPGWLDLYDSLS